MDIFDIDGHRILVAHCQANIDVRQLWNMWQVYRLQAKAVWVHVSPEAGDEHSFLQQNVHKGIKAPVASRRCDQANSSALARLQNQWKGLPVFESRIDIGRAREHIMDHDGLPLVAVLVLDLDDLHVRREQIDRILNIDSLGPDLEFLFKEGCMAACFGKLLNPLRNCSLSQRLDMVRLFVGE